MDSSDIAQEDDSENVDNIGIGINNSNDSEVKSDVGGKPPAKVSILRRFWYKFKKRAYDLDDLVSPYIYLVIPNFVLAHYFYILTWMMVCAVVLFAGGNMSFSNALFFGCATASQSGLNTIDLNKLYLYQQIFIYITCFFTSTIFVHSTVAFFRLYWYERMFHNIKQTSLANFKTRRAKTLAAITDRTTSRTRGEVNIQSVGTNLDRYPSPSAEQFQEDRNNGTIKFGDLPKPTARSGNPRDLLMSLALMQERQQSIEPGINEPPLHIEGPEGTQNSDADNDEEVDELNLSNVASSPANLRALKEYQSAHKGAYLSWNPTIGDNSVFVALTHEQKEELGGVEYRSMKLLCLILFCYYFGLHAIGCAFILPMAIRNSKYNKIIRNAGINPTWWSIFVSMSAITNLGYALTPDNLVSMSGSCYFLIVLAFLVYFGSSGFPITLRWIIIIIRRFSSPLSMNYQSLSFLLDHPRRCFTLLFPAPATLWLFIVLWAMSLSYWVLFIILDINNSALDLTKNEIVYNGFFQALSTRTAGLSSFSMGAMNPCMQMLTVAFMYIAVLPITMSVRGTNVYENQSLAIFSPKNNQTNIISRKKWNHEMLKINIRNQLSFDMWFLMIIICLICICETDSINQGLFGIFDIIFEVASGYGTVGLSIGFSGINASLSSKFGVLSKLLICLVMIRGRHRGLPVSLDRSIMLSKRNMALNDELCAFGTLKRINSQNTVAESEETRAEKKNWKEMLFFLPKLILHFVWGVFVFS